MFTAAPGAEAPGAVATLASAGPGSNHPAMSTPPATVVLATSNSHKVEELSELLRGLPMRLIGLAEARPGVQLREPEETGTTFEANARIKAMSYAEQTGLPCLADDSGLEIDALGGRPGVISSHYCTDGREVGMSRAERDRANNERVMRELIGVPDERRGASFVCVMALAIPPRVGVPERDRAPLVIVRGTFAGRIGQAGSVPRGENGFGYDPLFLVAPELTRTGAELPSEEKNKRSHRAQAAKLMLARIAAMLNENPNALRV